MSVTNPQISVFCQSLQTFVDIFPYQLGLSFCRRPQLYASKPADVCKSLRKILTLFFSLWTFADILDLEKIRH